MYTLPKDTKITNQILNDVIEYNEKFTDRFKKLGEYYDIQGKVTVPQIIIGGKRIGGFDVLDKLNNAGELDKLLED